MNRILHVKAAAALIAGVILLCSFHYSSKDTSLSYYLSNKDTLPCFLVVSDIHLDSALEIKQQNIPNSICNTGSDLWDSTKKKIREIDSISHPQLIMVLGDLMMHDTGENRMNTSAKRICSFLHDSLNKNIPIIIAPGNNDSKNGDYKRLSPGHFNLFYPDENNVACYSGNSDLNLGYYALYPFGKQVRMKIIVLNTVIFHVGYGAKQNYGCCQQQDALDELNWFFNQLQAAKQDSDQVLIATHIPPGIDGYYGNNLWSESLAKTDSAPSIQNIFLDSLFAYRDNIIGLLSGHSHMDGIRLLFDNTKADTLKMAGLLISVPGVAPGYGNNPSFKLIYYDPSKKFRFQNFTTYYMDYWKDANAPKLTSWKNKFNFRNEFHIPPSALNLLDALKSINASYLKQYNNSIYNSGSKKTIGKYSDSTIYVLKNK